MFWRMTISDLTAAGASLARALDGDRAAERLDQPMDSDEFAAFYERSARPLWAYLARVSGNPALADDLMQESYLRFLSAARPPRFQEGEVSSRRYLFRIASNLLKDHWRRSTTSSTNSIEDVGEEAFASPALRDSSSASRSVAQAMAQLSPRERQLLWLAHAEEYTHREIAEITGLASASIRLLLFRARRRAAKLLSQPRTIGPIDIGREIATDTRPWQESRGGKP